MYQRPSCFAAVACLLLLPGCTKKINLELSGPGPAYAEANDALDDGAAEITLRGGQVLQWRGVHMTPDVTTGLPLVNVLPPARAMGGGLDLETNTIALVTTRSRSKGALQGALFGAVGGALLGLATDPESLCDDCTLDCSVSKVEATGTLTLGGAIWGAVIGLIRTARTEIWIRE